MTGSRRPTAVYNDKNWHWILGLFKAARIMSAQLQINIENPQAIYLAGDKIKGQVVLLCAQDEAVGTVCITFSGRGKTKLIRHNGQSRRVFRARAPLFTQRLIL